MTPRFRAGWMAMVLTAGLVGAGTTAAQASVAGRRNTTYALGAATIYSLAKGKGTQGLLFGAATAYAYKEYRDAKRVESRRSRYQVRRSGSRYVRYARTHGR